MTLKEARHAGLCALVAWSLLTGAAPNPANGAVPDQADSLFGAWEVAGDAELEGLRGGFFAPGGLEINIGVAKVTSIDGIVEYHNTVNLPNLNFTGGGRGSVVDGTSQSVAPAEDIDVAGLNEPPQAASNNTASQLPAPASGQSPAAPQAPMPLDLPPQVVTIIQNTLDSRLIQDLTVLNVDVKNLSGARLSLPSRRTYELTNPAW